MPKINEIWKVSEMIVCLVHWRFVTSESELLINFFLNFSTKWANTKKKVYFVRFHKILEKKIYFPFFFVKKAPYRDEASCESHFQIEVFNIQV